MLATIGIVDCIFRCVGLRPSHFHSCAWGTAVLVPSRQGGTEQKRHHFFYLLLYMNCSLTGVLNNARDILFGCSYPDLLTESEALWNQLRMTNYCKYKYV